jgi:hypothetical protein
MHEVEWLLAFCRGEAGQDKEGGLLSVPAFEEMLFPWGHHLNAMTGSEIQT